MSARLRNVIALWLVIAAMGCNHATSPEVEPSSSPSSEPAPAANAEPTTTTSLFVSTGGNDEADGRSPESALATLSRAVEIARPGETIELMPGEYHQALTVEERGDMAAPVTIRGSSRGGAIVDGEGRLPFGLLLASSRNFVLADIEVRNFTAIGVAVWSCTQVVLRGLTVHTNGFDNDDPEFDGEGYGIDVEESSEILIENNETHTNGPGPAVRARGILGTGINTFGNRNIVIRANHTHDNIGGGILVEDSFHVAVEDNLVERNDVDVSAFQWWDGGLWVDGGGDVVVRNNTFRDNLGPGIELSDEDDQRPTGYVLENNVSRGNYFGVYIWNFGVCPLPSAQVLRLSGNDFSGNTRLDVWCQER